MATFTAYTELEHTPLTLVDYLLAPGSGIQLVPESTSVVYGRQFDEDTVYGTPSISFYDGSLNLLGIGSGLLLTSGDGLPSTQNTSDSYSVFFDTTSTDADLRAAVLAGFPLAGDVSDVTSLQFSFRVENPTLTGVRFDLVFGSEEYPEYVDSEYVDIAAVWVNGVNYALFGGNSNQPLSVISRNLAAGGFVDNTGGVLPIEYNGVSRVLTIVAPVVEGVNTLKIAIGDTGDEILDSGLFISNLRAVTYGGTGLGNPLPGTDGDDDLVGTPFRDVASMGAGDDTATGLGGDDLIDGGPGLDTAKYLGLLANHTISVEPGKVVVQYQPPVLQSFASGEMAMMVALVDENPVVDVSEPDEQDSGTDTLYSVERLLFSDYGYALDVTPTGDIDDPITKGEGGNAGKAYRLYQAAFARTPDMEGLGYWISVVDSGASLWNIADGFIGSEEFKLKYGDNPSNAEYTRALYANVLGREPDDFGYDYWNAALSGQAMPVNDDYGNLSGAYVGQTTRQQMLVDFSESQENKALVIGVIGNGFEYVPWV